MSECPNLREIYGKRYKITFDEGYNPRNVPRNNLDPWMMQIPCQRGLIYPYGEDLLAVEVDGHPGVAKQLLRLNCTTLIQDGEHEKTFRFPASAFREVARIVKPNRRRQMTPEQKAVAAARLKKYSFARKGEKSGAE